MSDKPTVIIEQCPVFESIQNGFTGIKTVIHIKDIPDIPLEPIIQEKIITLFEKETERIFKYVGLIKESNNDNRR